MDLFLDLPPLHHCDNLWWIKLKYHVAISLHFDLFQEYIHREVCVSLRSVFVDLFEYIKLRKHTSLSYSKSCVSYLAESDLLHYKRYDSQVTTGRMWVFRGSKESMQKKNNFSSTSSNYAGINKEGRLTTKTAHSGLWYKRVEAVTHVIEELYKNHKLFHNRLKVLENSVPFLAKVKFFDLHALKTKINGHGVDLDIPDKTIQNFLEVTNLISQ